MNKYNIQPLLDAAIKQLWSTACAADIQHLLYNLTLYTIRKAVLVLLTLYTIRKAVFSTVISLSISFTVKEVKYMLPISSMAITII